MPITVAHLTDGATNASQGSYETASISLSAGKLGLCTVFSRGGAGAAISGWTLIDWRTCGTGNGSTVWLFRRLGSASSGALTITFTSNPSRCGWCVDEFSSVDTGGTNGSGAIVQSATADNGGGNSSTTVTLAAFGSADNAAFGAFASYSADAYGAGSGFSVLANVDAGGSWDKLRGFAEWRDSNDTSVDATQSYSAGSGVAVEIKYAAPAASGQPFWKRWFGVPTGAARIGGGGWN